MFEILKPQQGHERATERIQTHLLKSLLGGVVGAVIHYALVALTKGSYFYVLFYDRGNMPIFCTVCTYIALSLLFFRWLENKKDFLAIFVLESHLKTVDKITPDSAVTLLVELKRKKEFSNSDLTAPRFSRLMRHQSSGASWAETESLVKGMDSFDQDAMESSYGVVKFLLWFIPILGFIGTVIGIGEAIGGFNTILTSTKDFDSMKTSLGAITDSLAYAFDSTLVALVEDAAVMFILTVIQKQGDDLLLEIDEVFTDDVLVKIEHIEPNQQPMGLGLNEETVGVLQRFADSTQKLTSLAKLDSFEKTFVQIQDSLTQLAPILKNLQKKRSLHLKLEEVEEPVETKEETG